MALKNGTTNLINNQRYVNTTDTELLKCDVIDETAREQTHIRLDSRCCCTSEHAYISIGQNTVWSIFE